MILFRSTESMLHFNYFVEKLKMEKQMQFNLEQMRNKKLIAKLHVNYSIENIHHHRSNVISLNKI